MKRRERQRRGRVDSEDQRFARLALEELRGAWKREELARTRLGQAARLMRLVAETRAGKNVTLQIVRKKQKMDVTVMIAETPEDSGRRAPAGPPAKSN